MPEPESDYELLVTVRVYGRSSAEDASRALMGYPGTFDLPHDEEVEILAAMPATATLPKRQEAP